MPFSRLTGPLRARPFVLLLSGRTVSMVGNAVAPIALAFAVLHLSGSAGDLGLVLAARTVPQVIFLLFGGVLADRFPRGAILTLCAGLAGLSQAVAAVLLLTGVAEVWQLAVIEAVNGTAAAVLFPATLSALPLSVPAAALQQANALFRLGRNVTMIMGAAAGGLAVAAVGSGWAIAIDAATFFLAALLWSRVRLAPARAPDAPRSSVLRELAEGWHDVRSRTWLWTIVVQFCFINAAWAAAFAVLGPVAAERRLGGAGPWGVVVSGYAVGLTLGAVAMMWLRPRRPLLAGNSFVLLTLPSVAFLALGVPAGWQAASAVLGGVGLEMSGVNWDLTMQRRIPADRLGRVYSYDAVGSFVFVPVGQVLAGPALGAFGLSGAIWVCGTVIGLSTLAIYGVRDVWALRAPA